jgi:hypothetical protein
MFIRSSILAAGLATSVAVAQTAGQPAQGQAQPTAPAAPATPPCSTAEYRQLDFWVGDWVATWTNANGSQGTGRNRITRDEYGPCVITERFTADDGSLRGFSISTYFGGAREWRQTWMDDQGGYFDLFGGPSTTPGQRFVLETYRRRPEARYGRMIFEDVQPDSFTWRWQGRATADAPWADLWVIRYTRARPAS